MNIIAVVNNQLDEKKVFESSPNGVYLTTFNISYHRDKKKGWEIMNYYGASETPFIVCNHGTNAPTPLYKEAFEDPIKEMKNFFNNK